MRNALGTWARQNGFIHFFGVEQSKRSLLSAELARELGKIEPKISGNLGDFC
jgi:hypothetical protein